ncbi:helix-turn-helix domain-containing protein [Streptomyces sp. NPDC029216]|uniref:helix-turn-helix domain-containing protein n=1 Tax=Streptomyces sp. NPDC029216 TaxID=3154701 RepID=UPI0033EAD241
MEDPHPSIEVGDHLAQHPELSLLAIGLAVHIQSLPEGSPIGIKVLAERFPEGEVRVAGGLRELEAAGYLERGLVRTGDGRLITRTVFYRRPKTAPPPDEPPPTPPTPPTPPADRAPVPEPETVVELAAVPELVPVPEPMRGPEPVPGPEPVSDPGPARGSGPVSDAGPARGSGPASEPRPAPVPKPAPEPRRASEPAAPVSVREPVSGRESVAVPKVVPPAEVPAPRGPVRQEAVDLLARLRQDDPRLLLSERDVRRLAPGASAWLERGAEPEAIRQVLAAGLPADVRSPAALIGYRLKAGVPPELPREEPARQAHRRPDPLQNCDGCDKAFRAPEPGRCKTCPPPEQPDLAA